MPWYTEWSEAAAQALLKPFPANEIDLREGLSYIDARTVQRRLDEVVGPGGWSFAWEPVEVTTDHVALKGSLTVLGVTKSDAGEAHAIKNSRIPEELVKFAVSDAIKRCAVQFGIGRFLYEMPKSQGGRVSDDAISRAADRVGYQGDPVVEPVICSNCAADVEWSYAQSVRRKAGKYLCPTCAGQLEVHTARPITNGNQCNVCKKALLAQELQGCMDHPDWFDNGFYCYEHAKAYRLDKKAREILANAGVKVS